MTEQHPITPPPELVRHWSRLQGATHPEALWFRIANEAAQWGADQELEAIIAWMKRMGYWGEDGQAIPLLRAARRPKPPSLKEQALVELDNMIKAAKDFGFGGTNPIAIRRALEALPDD